MQVRTVEDVFKSNEPSLAKINKEFGQTGVRAAVAYLISEALEFFNASNTMSDTQVALTVDLIIEEYPYFKTDDVKLALRNAMKMKYGQIYNRIDGQVIMGWMQDYNRERCTVADMVSYNDHKRILHENSTPLREGVYYDQYVADLKKKASEGDKEAKKLLELSEEVTRKMQSFKARKI